MLQALFCMGWLMVGMAIGRIAFVRLLGDQERRQEVTWRNVCGEAQIDTGWTKPFTRAVWASVVCLVLWPAALPVLAMFAYTGEEKLRMRRDQLQADVDRMEEMDRIANRSRTSFGKEIPGEF